ncbi:DUF2971 domain-containing protein [Aminobacter sp. Piv2-1]|uniref:DUF2971 domain-containing protein n=1 Tax=Aminobacter sp. Piv2-1 TaxID=3031122 RepID=UPI00309FE7A8
MGREANWQILGGYAGKVQRRGLAEFVTPIAVCVSEDRALDREKERSGTNPDPLHRIRWGALMRLYRFLSAEYGFRSLQEKRLRIGRIEELNDDFEFLGLALAEKTDRIALREVRRHLHVKSGVLCMSEAWDSPLMWAHYAESHKGMVLGFDVPERAFYKVDYTGKRPSLADMGLSALDDITPEDIKRLTRTKADGWSYEREYRAYLALKDGVEINGAVHYFLPFSTNLRLREVIVGSRYKGKRQEVIDAVHDTTVEVYMARGSFEEFRMVRQRQDRMWP